MVQALDDRWDEIKIKMKVARPAHVSGLGNKKKREIRVISKF